MFRRIGATAVVCQLMALLLTAAPAEADPRKYAIIMDALGRTGVSAQSLDDLESSLVKTGTNPQEAEAAILTIVPNPRMPLELTSQIVPLARDVGAITGVGIASATAQLVATMTGGWDAIRDLGLKWNFLSVAEDRQIGVMQRHGDLLGVQKLAIAAMDRQFAGSYQRLRDLGMAPVGAPASTSSADCNANSTVNLQAFAAALRELQAGHAGTTAELQKVVGTAAEPQKIVVNFCAAGKPEREAFAAVMAILQSQPIEGAK